MLDVYSVKEYRKRTNNILAKNEALILHYLLSLSRSKTKKKEESIVIKKEKNSKIITKVTFFKLDLKKKIL